VKCTIAKYKYSLKGKNLTNNSIQMETLKFFFMH